MTPSIYRVREYIPSSDGRFLVTNGSNQSLQDKFGVTVWDTSAERELWTMGLREGAAIELAGNDKELAIMTCDQARMIYGAQKTRPTGHAISWS